MGKLAIIGGSGIKDAPSFKDAEWQRFDTEFSEAPNTGIVNYQVDDLENPSVIFIPRHGHRTKVGPANTPYLQNLVAAKALGASAVIAFSAVGSLTDKIPVKSLVIPNDYVDESGRDDNVFGKGFVVHANPRPAFSRGLRKLLIGVGHDHFDQVFGEATYVVIPGDRFGTTAEGLKRSQYADIVGMTACPEASMATQLGLHYGLAALPVDRDGDANHEHSTLKVMGELSDIVPAYVDTLLEPAKDFAKDPGRLEQLVGNIIPGRVQSNNPYLKRFAEELQLEYCS